MPSSKADIVATKTASSSAVVVVVALKCIKCSRLEEVEEKKKQIWNWNQISNGTLYLLFSLRFRYAFF